MRYAALASARKPLSPVETARLYEEIKILEKEDAERRQAATRFGSTGDEGGANGGSESLPPHGKTNSIAAQIVTGTDASQRLDRINWIRSVAEDESLGASVREFAANMLTEIDNDAPVAPAYKRVKAAVELASSPPPPSQDEEDEVARLAAEALKRVQEEENAKRLRALRSKAKRAPKHHSPRSFVLMWSELEGWTALYDIGELAAALKDEDWARFERVVAETIELRDRLREARTAAASA
jgi:ParB family chromosome partitioning protein